MTLTLDLSPEIIEATAEPAPIISEEAFLMGAEGTRHIWDTPEEDQAWAHLQ